MDVSGISLPSVPWCEYWYILELEVSSSAFFSPPYLVILLTPTQLWLILYSDSLLVILQAILPSVFIDLIYLSCSLSLLNVFFLISYCFMLYFQEITEQCSVLPLCPDSWMLQVLLRSKSKTSFIPSFWLAKGEQDSFQVRGHSDLFLFFLFNQKHSMSVCLSAVFWTSEQIQTFSRYSERLSPSLVSFLAEETTKLSKIHQYSITSLFFFLI